MVPISPPTVWTLSLRARLESISARRFFSLRPPMLETRIITTNISRMIPNSAIWWMAAGSPRNPGVYGPSATPAKR